MLGKGGWSSSGLRSNVVGVPKQSHFGVSRQNQARSIAERDVSSVDTGISESMTMDEGDVVVMCMGEVGASGKAMAIDGEGADKTDISLLYMRVYQRQADTNASISEVKSKAKRKHMLKRKSR